MTDNKIPEQFDWVNARSECSVPHIFKELEQGVRDDVEAAQSLVPSRYEIKFSVVQSSTKRFSAIRVDDPMRGISSSVDFVCTRDRIETYDDNSKLLLSASLTLNNEGKCRLLVGDAELTQWQFRRKALEKLLFGPFE